MGNMKIKYGMVDSVSNKNDGYYPSLTIPGKAIPELKDKKIGSTCMLMIKGKIKSMRDESHSGISYDIEVQDAKYHEDMGMKDE